MNFHLKPIEVLSEMTPNEPQLSRCNDLLSSRKDLASVWINEQFNALTREFKVAVVHAVGVSQSTAFGVISLHYMTQNLLPFLRGTDQMKTSAFHFKKEGETTTNAKRREGVTRRRLVVVVSASTAKRTMPEWHVSQC